jgi:hypothetical protein
MDPATVATDPSYNNNDPSPQALRRAYSFRRVEDLRKIMEDNGDAERKVAALEMGWTSDMRASSPYRWHAVTEQQKGEYLAGAFRYARERWPWMAFMTVIYFPDPKWSPDQEQLYWGITNQDGSPRDAYRALKDALAGKS